MCKCSLLCVICLVWGLWHLLHYGFWALSGTPLGYPVVAFCYVHPVALDRQYWPLHVFQQFIDKMDVKVGQLIALVLKLGGSWVGQLVILTTRASSPALP